MTAYFPKELWVTVFAILPENDTLYAPCDGEVTVLMDESRHACGLTLENGMEILLHIGIDTVEMQGDGFEYLVNQGDVVEAGTPLIRFDRDKIQKAGKRAVTIMAVTDGTGRGALSYRTGMDAQAGETVVAEIEE